MEKYKFNKLYRLFSGSIAIIVLFLIQIFSGKGGWTVANIFSYKLLDPYDIFASISVHHFVQMFIALTIIAVLSKLFKIDFGFSFGESKIGIKYLIIFTAAYATIAIASHIFMYIFHQLPTYDFPLNKNNIIGTLGFQLFLSGPSEEILYRALPITVLSSIFRNNIKIQQEITIEVIIASLLFSIAHINWNLSPFTIKVDYFQLFYAFILGVIQGIVYQKSRSIVYPALMHSVSNFLMVGSGYLLALF